MTTENATRRICCIEGEWGYGGTKDEPSIEPILKLFSQWEYWPYDYRRCRNADEVGSFLADKWGASGSGSVLYFATHGAPGSIRLSKGGRSVGLAELAGGGPLRGRCAGCYVHISACNVFADDDAVEGFLRETGAAAVSGYRTNVGWAEPSKPALPLDIMLLNQLWEGDIDFSNGRRFKPKLRKIEADLQRRFGDCQFNVVLAK